MSKKPYRSRAMDTLPYDRKTFIDYNINPAIDDVPRDVCRTDDYKESWESQIKQMRASDVIPKTINS